MQRRFPRMGWLGVTVMVVGFGLDLIAHTLLPAAPPVGGFTPSQHAAHFVVFLGMVLVLAAVVIGGSRHASGRHVRPEGRDGDAVR